MTRVAIRCDGGTALGAGHVGRCVPVAAALVEGGARVTFVGEYEGVAAWLLDRNSFVARRPSDGPCGLSVRDCDAAVIDLYAEDGGAAVCRAAEALPIATLGESSRCQTAGIWVDYHAGARAESGPRRLGGLSFVPIDPRLATGRHAPREVGRILVATGGSARFGALSARMADAAAAAFPDAEILAAGTVASAATTAVTALPSPFDLADLAPTIDLAVTGAGMTTYELAGAGIPTIAVALVENQRVVLDGCRRSGIALAVDGIARDPLADLAAALNFLHDRPTRTALGTAAARAIDGHGAERIAKALLSAWTRPGASGPGR